jgi:hypothetical protein
VVSAFSLEKGTQVRFAASAKYHKTAMKGH